MVRGQRLVASRYHAQCEWHLVRFTHDRGFLPVHGASDGQQQSGKNSDERAPHNKRNPWATSVHLVDGADGGGWQAVQPGIAGGGRHTALQRHSDQRHAAAGLGAGRQCVVRDAFGFGKLYVYRDSHGRLDTNANCDSDVDHVRQHAGYLNDGSAERHRGCAL